MEAEAAVEAAPEAAAEVVAKGAVEIALVAFGRLLKKDSRGFSGLNEFYQLQVKELRESKLDRNQENISQTQFDINSPF